MRSGWESMYRRFGGSALDFTASVRASIRDARARRMLGHADEMLSGIDQYTLRDVGLNRMDVAHHRAEFLSGTPTASGGKPDPG